MSILEKLSSKSNVAVFKFDEEIVPLIKENGCGHLFIKCNETPFIVVNGITKNQYNEWCDKLQISESVYKTTNDFTEFKTAIKNIVVNEDEVEIYERQSTNMYLNRIQPVKYIKI